MENDLKPELFLRKLFHFWWLLVLITVAGGAIGLAFTLLHPAVYESKAAISTTLDYVFIEKMDDWEEDQIFQSIGDIIKSTPVLQQVQKQAEAQGISISATQLQNDFETDRQDTRWVMRVRNPDPQKAQTIASLWSNAAMDALSQLRVNAISSIAVQRSLDSLASCLRDKVVVDPSSALCPEMDVSAVKEKLAQIASDPALQPVWNALALSHTSFELTEEASLPSTPVLYRRNLSALAGMIAGLVVGVWLIGNDRFLKFNPTGTK